MEQIDYNLLLNIADLDGTPNGAFNLRRNGQGVERHSTENILITPKTDKPGIDIYIKPYTKNESVHIPVIVTESGIKDLVYNDFIIGEGADVTIIAGCGIHNDGCDTSEHDGIHCFQIGKGARLKYVEKHYGEGNGTGGRVLNPTTIVNMDEDSYCEMEMAQIGGVDSTIRETTANLKAGAKMVVLERLLTHGEQTAHSNMDVNLNGKDAAVQIISRSVAQDQSVQVFHPKAIGNDACRAHVQCDSIIMDNAKVSSIPEITANHADAQIVHEAAIGRINNDQLIKLQTFGLDESEAENVIIQGFLK
jgi:Fe-S cluster assembly scaffold protein SufB